MNEKKGIKIKIRGSFEWANDFVNFVNENKDLKYSGKVLTKSQISGQSGKKKAGVFVYEIQEANVVIWMIAHRRDIYEDMKRRWTR